MPHLCAPSDKPGEGWKLLAEDKDERVYVSVQNLEKQIPDTSEILNNYFLRFVGLIFLPLCLFFLGKTMLNSNMFFWYKNLSFIICGGYALSIFMEPAELFCIKKAAGTGIPIRLASICVFFFILCVISAILHGR